MVGFAYTAEDSVPGMSLLGRNPRLTPHGFVPIESTSHLLIYSQSRLADQKIFTLGGGPDVVGLVRETVRRCYRGKTLSGGDEKTPFNVVLLAPCGCPSISQ